VGPRAGMDVFKTAKFFCLYRDLNSVSPPLSLDTTVTTLTPECSQNITQHGPGLPYVRESQLLSGSQKKNVK
jgi:hypothetical protein